MANSPASQNPIHGSILTMPGAGTILPPGRVPLALLPFVISSWCCLWQQTVRSSADWRTHGCTLLPPQSGDFPYSSVLLGWRLNVSDSLSFRCQGSGLNERLSSIDSSPKWLWVLSSTYPWPPSHLIHGSRNWCLTLVTQPDTAAGSWPKSVHQPGPKPSVFICHALGLISHHLIMSASLWRVLQK